MGLLGFNKSGKTFTAVKIAIGVWDHFGKKGRIAFFDTEAGSQYIVPMVEKSVYGKRPVGVRSRSFADLIATTRELQEDDVFIVDSITHPWRELCDSHLENVNERRKKKGQRPRAKLEFQDWNPIKNTWSAWTDWYLNSKCHIIICGRAGYEYDMEVNDETGRKELIKSGVKMKTENEFGFEPSLLVEMERQQVERDGHFTIVRRATVLGDRFQVLDGKSFDNPSFETWLPHIRLLTPGAHAPVDTTHKSDTGADDAGDEDYQRERREREIVAEEVKGLFQQYIPGQAAADKTAKADLMQRFFGSRSWTRIEGMPLGPLRAGMRKLRDHFEPEQTGKFAYLEDFQALKKEIGDERYYALLSVEGYEKSNQIPVHKRAAVLARMRQELQPV
jgi:hypothetical protein